MSNRKIDGYSSSERKRNALHTLCVLLKFGIVENDMFDVKVSLEQQQRISPYVGDLALYMIGPLANCLNDPNKRVQIESELQSRSEEKFL